jgi:formylglycine-generating enzyme required for sulfatase activity
VKIKTDGIEIGPLIIKPFFIAQYQVTYAQYQAFVEAEDGFDNLEWWQDFPENYRRQPLSDQVTKNANYPRDSVSWYQSVAFARWLDAKYRKLGLFGQLPVGTPYEANLDEWQIRLPTEWEWQWAAQGGTEARAYPWGGWRRSMANTSDSGLGRAIAVGMYPHGGAECGALDMAGNLYEWCQNDTGDPAIVDGYSNGNSKVLRGGSFNYFQNYAAASYRSYRSSPYSRYHDYGFRVVVSAPIASLSSGTLNSESE